MKKQVQRTRREEIYKAILQLETLEECMDFFDEVCTKTELRSIEQRFEVARMLSRKCVYSEIMEKTSASTATISRVSRVFNEGNGMLDIALERLEKTEEA